MKQSTALDILKSGKNVFLTGSAGAGKTYTLNHYLHYLRARDIHVAVTASTGIAATHMNGMTIHSWAGIGILDELTPKDIARIKKRATITERMQKTHVLIIDEISMLHKKQFDLINHIMQEVRDNLLPFGGVQVIVAGDFFQLPPVGERGETTKEKFAFMSQAWLDADFQICYLSEQYRQTVNSDETVFEPNSDSLAPKDRYFGLDLNAILNQIRRQDFTPEIVPALEATTHHVLDGNCTRLYTHNFNVQTINNAELEKLNTPTMTYTGFGLGEEKLVETLKKSVRNSPDLILKLGAKVMFLKNNSDQNVSNGTMGEIVDFVRVIEDKDKLEAKTSLEKRTKLALEVAEKQVLMGDLFLDNGFSEHSLLDNNIAKNNPLENRLVDDKNGKTTQAGESQSEDNETDNLDATNIKFSTEKYPVVLLNDGRKVIAEQEVWQVEDEEGEIIAAYYHIPLTLAWAITIHKSQGMTLEVAEIDLSKTFEKGQGYVALSRLKSLSGLRLLGMNHMVFQLDSLALGADKRFMALSQQQAEQFLNQPSDEIAEAHKAFIIRHGGTLDKQKIALYEKRLEQRQKALQIKVNVLKNSDAKADDGKGGDKAQTATIFETKNLLNESLTIAEVADVRKLAQSTIMNHIEQLLTLGETLSLDHIRPDDSQIKPIKKAYEQIKKLDRSEDKDEQGKIKIKPIFEKLSQKYTYNEIRLALLFIRWSY